MQIIDKYSTLNISSCVASIGFFDGVHSGHLSLIHQVIDQAKQRGLKSGLITFPVHPSKVMNPSLKIDHLTTKEEKTQQLDQLGLDYCFLLDFTKELSQLTAREFMDTVLRKRFHVSVLYIGYDHRFGHNRSEGFEDYRRYGKELGIEVIQADAHYEAGVDVSSSMIRRALKTGDLDLAERYLGYPYFICGKVVEGKKLGRTIGFPTANISLNSEAKLLPKDGVYAVKVGISNYNKEFWGMLNIGVCPTVDNKAIRTIEVNILDFDGDIYGSNVKLTFKQWLRPEVKFESLELLIHQLHKDEQDVRNLIRTKKKTI